MTFLRLIILALLIYLAIKLFEKFARSRPPQQTQVNGKEKTTKALDLTGKDVEDAKFEEIDE